MFWMTQKLTLLVTQISMILKVKGIKIPGVNLGNLRVQKNLRRMKILVQGDIPI